MAVYISDSLLVSTAEETPDFINPNSPRIGIQNLSNKANIYPGISDVQANPSWLTATPSTAERWKSEGADFHVWSFDVGGQEIDYFGMAAYRGLIGRQVEAYYTPFEGGPIVHVFGPQVIANAETIFVLFEKARAGLFFIKFESDEDFDVEVGIVNVGVSVALPRNIYVGHTPIKLARRPQTRFSNSDNGQFLGQVTTKTTTQVSVSMENIPPGYYRDSLFNQFQIPAERSPFFWAWRPQKYPYETGFCWLPDGSINVQNSMANGFMQMSFSMTGYING